MWVSDVRDDACCCNDLENDGMNHLYFIICEVPGKVLSVGRERACTWLWQLPGKEGRAVAREENEGRGMASIFHV